MSCFSEGKPLVTLCSDASLGFIGFREQVFFISYETSDISGSSGFKMQYRFVEDNFTPPPPPVTTPSPVGGNNGITVKPVLSGHLK